MKRIIVIFSSVLFLGLLLFVAGYFFQEHLKNSKAEELSTVKVLPSISAPSIGAKKVNLETKYISSYIYYKFSVDVSDKDTMQISKSGTFTVSLLDKDGFKLHTLFVPVNEMVATVNAKGETEGYSINSKDAGYSEDYERFEEWEVSWNF